MHRNILVTGGAGFIGSRVALAIKGRWPAAKVIAFDNLRRRGAELNLADLHAAGVGFVHGDVRCREDLEGVAPPPDAIIECSADPSAIAGYGGSPEYVINTNLMGCLNCLELARRRSADLLFLSSSRVYPYLRLNELSFSEGASRYHLSPGQTVEGASQFGIAEKFPLEGPRSVYGVTKLCGELLIAEYGDAYGIRYVINRCGVITGPGQMGKADQGVFVFWMAAHYFRCPLRYIGFGGQGKQVRDFLHVNDLTDLILLQLEDFTRYSGGTFNIGGGTDFSLSLLECTRLCQEITGNIVAVEPDATSRPGDVRIYVTDQRRITELSGWRPQLDASATFADIHGWLRAQESELKAVLNMG
jgi:CDP-paratose 2-epimerase